MHRNNAFDCLTSFFSHSFTLLSPSTTYLHSSLHVWSLVIGWSPLLFLSFFSSTSFFYQLTPLHIICHQSLLHLFCHLPSSTVARLVVVYCFFRSINRLFSANIELKKIIKINIWSFFHTTKYQMWVAHYNFYIITR